MAGPDAAAPLALKGELTTPGSESVHRAIRDGLEAGNRLILDCSAADEIDVSFLQLLYATQRAAEPAGKTVSLAAPVSGALADALRRCGFAPAAGASRLAEIFAAPRSTP